MFSPQIFWEHINELESDEQIPDGATEIDGTLSKYISFWLTEDKIDVTLLLLRTTMETLIYMQRITHAIIVIVLFLAKQSATISSYMKICI